MVPGVVRYNFTGLDGTGPSQPRFTRSASINHHKLSQSSLQLEIEMLCWCEVRADHTPTLWLLFSLGPRSVGSSHGNNKSIFVFDEDVASDKSTIFVVIFISAANEDMFLPRLVVVLVV